MFVQTRGFPASELPSSSRMFPLSHKSAAREREDADNRVDDASYELPRESPSPWNSRKDEEPIRDAFGADSMKTANMQSPEPKNRKLSTCISVLE